MRYFVARMVLLAILNLTLRYGLSVLAGNTDDRFGLGQLGRRHIEVGETLPRNLWNPQWIELQIGPASCRVERQTAHGGLVLRPVTCGGDRTTP
jgi:hypothetical protein